MIQKILTPERFAKGLTFDQYVAFVGSPENLAREGFDVRPWGFVRPRVDWSAHLRERHAKAQLSDEQAAMIRSLVAAPGGPARVAVIAEDWSSDCRRDLRYLARLAEAGPLELGGDAAPRTDHQSGLEPGAVAADPSRRLDASPSRCAHGRLAGLGHPDRGATGQGDCRRGPRAPARRNPLRAPARRNSLRAAPPRAPPRAAARRGLTW